MQKTIATSKHATGLGSMLLAKLSKPTAIKTATATRTLTPIIKTATKLPPVAGRTGLFEPMFRQHALQRDALRKAASVPVTVPKPAMRAPGEAAGTNYGIDIDLDNPLHVHAVQCRQSAAAHASLLDQIKAATNPHLRPSRGPEAQ